MAALQTHIILSTEHLDRDTSEMLDDMGEDTSQPRHFGDWRDRIVRCGFGYGHWVKVPRPDEDDPDDTLEARMSGMPRSLVDCLGHAASFGAAWIMFDRDEAALADIPQYNW